MVGSVFFYENPLGEENNLRDVGIAAGFRDFSLVTFIACLVTDIKAGLSQKNTDE